MVQMITKDILIKNLYVYNEKGRIHLLNVKNGKFSVDPRTDGTIVPEQSLKSLFIDVDDIVLTSIDGKEYLYKL